MYMQIFVEVLNHQESVRLIKKLEDVTGAASPTLFRLVNFGPENCCLVLSYEVTLETGATATRNFIVDCSDIAGVSYVNDGDLGTGNSI